MRFAPINALVSATKRADPILNAAGEPISRPRLLAPCAPTDRTTLTYPRQGNVNFAERVKFHI